MLTNLRNWSLENGAYVSPRYPDATSYGRVKRFLIRAQVSIDCDERNRILKIPVSGDAHEKNVELLRKMHLIEQ